VRLRAWEWPVVLPLWPLAIVAPVAVRVYPASAAAAKDRTSREATRNTNRYVLGSVDRLGPLAHQY
jgi:hypothetical protein